MDFPEDLRQLKSQLDLVLQREKVERQEFNKDESDLRELRRQYYTLQIENKENERLLNQTIKVFDNYQKSLLKPIDENKQLMLDFCEKSDAILSENSLLQKAIREAEFHNFQRFQNLPNDLSQEAISNMKNQLDSVLNDISYQIETETAEFTNMQQNYKQWKIEGKIMTTNLATFVTGIRKHNIRFNLRKAKPASGFKRSKF